jgi:phosphoglycolate phosphatase
VIAGTLHEIVPLIAPLLPFMSAERIAEDLESRPPSRRWCRPCPSTRCCGAEPDGYALGVATNATRSELDAHLDAAGIALAFDFVAGCDSGHGAKPGPGMCLAFAAHLGCAPETVVMVGDSLHDLKAGRAAGMRTVGVLTGLARRMTCCPSPMRCWPTSVPAPMAGFRPGHGHGRGGEETTRGVVDGP